mgnify:CR=1 FL=1
MEKLYSAFNINLLSRDIELPELISSNDGNFQVEIIKKNLKEPKETNNFNYKFENLMIRKNQLILKVKGIGDFEICEGKNIYWNNTKQNYKESEIRAYLLGSALGALLIQRNNLVLHANSLSKGEKTIICVGNAGSGKSTLAFSLMSRGWKLISDDLVAINNELYVLPGIPRIKLWEDAISFYKIQRNNLEKVRSDMKKFQLLERSTIKSVTGKSKITSIYVLNNNLNQIIKDSITTEKEKYSELIQHIYRPLYVKGLKKEINYFNKLSNLIKDIPVYKLSLPRPLSKMEEWLNYNDKYL